MGLKTWLAVFLVCVLVFSIILAVGNAMGYFADTESSLDNTLRIAESW